MTPPPPPILAPLPLAGDGTYRLDKIHAGRPERQAVLLEIAGRKHQGGVDISVDVDLVREPTNQYDPRAVRVEIGGQLVGYLSREHARDVALTLALNGDRQRATCKARIVGGWKRQPTPTREGSEGDFGVRLDVVMPPRMAAEVAE